MCYDISHGIPLLNRLHINGVNFSVKDDLNRYVDQINFKLGDASKHIYYPRTYLVETDDDVVRFHREFHFTVVFSLIQHLYENRPANKFFCQARVDTSPPYGLDFALRYVERMIDMAQRVGVEAAMQLPQMGEIKFSTIQWRQIMIALDDVVKRDKRFRVEVKEAEAYVKRIQAAGKFLSEHYPRRKHEVSDALADVD